MIVHVQVFELYNAWYGLAKKDCCLNWETRLGRCCLAMILVAVTQILGTVTRSLALLQPLLVV